MSDDSDIRYEKPRDVVVRNVGGEMVALNLVEAEYHALNPVGRRCYELLADGRSVAETVDEVHAAYPDATVDQIRSDVAGLIPQLIEAGLLRQAIE